MLCLPSPNSYIWWWYLKWCCFVVQGSPSHTSKLVETSLPLTRWHSDDAIPTRPLSLHCLPNSQHSAKSSPMAYIVITYSKRTHITSPSPLPFLGFCSPLFSPLLISIVTILSHARAFLLASCHILLLSSCLEVSLSQAGRVELLWVLPAFARCSFGVGS